MVAHNDGLHLGPNNDQLPVCQIAQLVELCTGIAEVRVGVPFRPFAKLHNKTAKIINIKIDSIRSSNGISLI